MRYANVTASLALAVALGGTSYAAVKLPRDSVHARQIASGAVRSDEIRDGSIRHADLGTDALPSSNPLDVYVVHSQAGSSNCVAGDTSGGCGGTQEISNSALCRTGDVALGGSVVAPDGFDDMRVVADGPTVDENTGIPFGWRGTIRYTANGKTFGQPAVTAVCAKQSSG